MSKGRIVIEVRKPIRKNQKNYDRLKALQTTLATKEKGDK